MIVVFDGMLGSEWCCCRKTSERKGVFYTQVIQLEL
jgi:hypothetical protein